MSQNRKPETTVADISSLPTDEKTNPVEEKKPNVIVRGFRKIKQTPPKTALAVAGGVALVTAGAMLGRKTAPLHVEIVDSDTEIEPMLVTPASDDDNDSTVA